MTLAENAFGPPHRVVDSAVWHDEVRALREDGYRYFDWLSAVDEHPEGFRLVVHLLRPDPWHHLIIATFVERDEAAVTSIADVFAGAAWHERETHEMFGIEFTPIDPAHPVSTDPLLLPDGFEGHPLRKEFVLASRMAKAWPGAKEPGESDAESTHAPSRRRIKPPGVPDDWLKHPASGEDVAVDDSRADRDE